jgi:hypothetical protein
LHVYSGTSGTLPAFSWIFFLYIFFVRDSGKQVQCAGSVGELSFSGTGRPAPPTPRPPLKPEGAQLRARQGLHPVTVGDTPSKTPLESTPYPGPQMPRFAIPEGPFPEYI